MKINELRIGNIITLKKNRNKNLLSTISQISFSGRVEIEQSAGSFGINEIEGVPINYDNYNLYGITKQQDSDDKDTYWFTINIGSIRLISDPYDVEDDMSGVIIPLYDTEGSELYKLEYVHELQNLYFAIKRKELT
jgi:hypothetical protein